MAYVNPRESSEAVEPYSVDGMEAYLIDPDSQDEVVSLGPGGTPGQHLLELSTSEAQFAHEMKVDEREGTDANGGSDAAVTDSIYEPMNDYEETLRGDIYGSAENEEASKSEEAEPSDLICESPARDEPLDEGSGRLRESPVASDENLDDGVKVEPEPEVLKPIVNENRPPRTPKEAPAITKEYLASLRTDDEELLGEMEELQDTFFGLRSNYYLLDKIGQGTFSSVYKGVDLKYDEYENDWDRGYNRKSSIKMVAIKRIYVTSSPARIANELEILRTLSGSSFIIPIITALRDRDQVLAVLPYFPHTDFRAFYKRMSIGEIRRYVKQILHGLDFVHMNGIIHRDVKPTNFLYDVRRGCGVLVDFGLAEISSHNFGCPCVSGGSNMAYLAEPAQSGYRKDDTRSGRRANRAGTRGFRAPEVLLKCAAQDTKLDIWSTGVIFLTLVSKRFPFFNSDDDNDALIEIATIFGRKKLQMCALLHGSIFETDIPTIHEDGYTLAQVIEWCLNDHPTKFTSAALPAPVLSEDMLQGLDLMAKMMELDYRKRLSASEALEHPFFQPEKTNPDEYSTEHTRSSAVTSPEK